LIRLCDQFDRAKGLEFRAVLLVRLGKSRFSLQEPTQAASQGLADEESESAFSNKDKEERQLHLDRLYAAMTRARDQLFLIASEEPRDEIARAFGRIDRERQALGA
jgi:superfamily I DNA/RNA helicase